MSNASKFSITGSRDGGIPSTILKPSAISSHPVYIQIHINNQPIKAIVDTGSPISIIHIEFLKTIKHENFRRQTQSCRTLKSTPLNIIGQITLKIKLKSITTYTNVYVATYLITSILLGNDWINTNHIHLFGDQQQLTIPDQYGQCTTISCVEPTFINQPAFLVNQTTLPPYSQTLVDITYRIYNDKDLIFEPQLNHLSNCIL
ncbi:unnamed protein product, partial [Rotaria magnacalcarata]